MPSFSSSRQSTQSLAFHLRYPRRPFLLPGFDFLPGTYVPVNRPDFEILGVTLSLGLYFLANYFMMSRMTTEPPFTPREVIIEKQKLFQSIHKHTYLKGPYDKITSVAIPLALAGSALFLIGRGIYNMSHGIGKKA